MERYEGQCPACGYEPGWEENEYEKYCVVTDESHDHGAEICGPAHWGARSWIENWTCPKCGTKFSFENANY